MNEPIAVRASGRVNLIGDHTDYTGGLALPMAIDRSTEIRGAPHDRVRLRSADGDGDTTIDLARTVAVGDADGWGRYVAAVVAEMAPTVGIDGTVTTTIPVGAGLSSSAALELAVALALGFDGSPLELARLGQRAEHAATGVPTGLLDQLCIASAIAGHATLIDAAASSAAPVPIPDDVTIVVRHVTSRTLEGSGYADRVAECTAAEARIGPLRAATLGDLADLGDDRLRRRARHVITENERVSAFVAALAVGDHVAAGALMTASHDSLRDDFAVSTPAMDAAVAALVATPGVHGARMTGGGFGGCVVAWCRPDASVEGWRVRPVAGVGQIED